MDRALLDFAIELVEEAGGLAARPVRRRRRPRPPRHRRAPSLGHRPAAPEGTPVDVELEEPAPRPHRRRASPTTPSCGEESGAARGDVGPPLGARPAERHHPVRPADADLQRARSPSRTTQGPAAAVAGYPMSDELRLRRARASAAGTRSAAAPHRRVSVDDTGRLRGALVGMLNSAELVGGAAGRPAPRRTLSWLGRGCKGSLDSRPAAADAPGDRRLPHVLRDLAVLPVLVGEAGRPGRPTCRATTCRTGDGSVLASNGRLHDELLELVRRHAARPRLPGPAGAARATAVSAPGRRCGPNRSTRTRRGREAHAPTDGSRLAASAKDAEPQT